MKITFVHHSCFCVENADMVLIFDYFRGERMPEHSFRGMLPEFPREQSVYVFSSHQHRDHFDLEIFTWQEKYPNIQYILPKGIRLSDSYLLRNQIDPSVKERIHYMKANTALRLNDLKIETFQSTDEGVAFLVTCEGKCIYHAGDLNWWHWEGEDPAFNEYQEKTYKAQIDLLSGRRLDAAFVVLDPRLGQDAFRGIDYFLNHTDAQYVIPMHLWHNYDLIRQYKARPETEAFRSRILEVTGENQIFQLT